MSSSTYEYPRKHKLFSIFLPFLIRKINLNSFAHIFAGHNVYRYSRLSTEFATINMFIISPQIIDTEK